MQNRRGWCDSSTGFQPSPCASIRAPARQAIELNRRRLPRRARESEGGLRYTATADGPFLATRIPVSARTSQAWLRRFNSAFVSRLFRVASIAAMQRSLKPQSTGQHRGDSPLMEAEPDKRAGTVPKTDRSALRKGEHDLRLPPLHADLAEHPCTHLVNEIRPGQHR